MENSPPFSPPKLDESIILGAVCREGQGGGIGSRITSENFSAVSCNQDKWE